MGVTAPIKATYNPRQRRNRQKFTATKATMEDIMAKHKAKMTSVTNRPKTGEPKKKKQPASHLGAGMAEVTGWADKATDLETFLKVKKQELAGLRHSSKLGLGMDISAVDDV